MGQFDDFSNPWSASNSQWYNEEYTKWINPSFNKNIKSLTNDSDLIKKIKKKYKVSKVYKWYGYVNDKREKNVVKIIEDVASELSIIPSYLCTIAIGEGLGLWIDDNYDSKKPHNVIINNKINGFDYLGVDHFSSDFNRVKKFLPKDYNIGDEFTEQERTNEHGQQVMSSVFKNLKSGIYAIGSVLAHRKELLINKGIKLNYNNPNEDEIAYWMYVYFQGEGRAGDYLESNDDFDYTKKPPINMRQIKRLSLERVASWRYMQSKSIFIN